MIMRGREFDGCSKYRVSRTREFEDLACVCLMNARSTEYRLCETRVITILYVSDDTTYYRTSNAAYFNRLNWIHKKGKEKKRKDVVGLSWLRCMIH